MQTLGNAAEESVGKTVATLALNPDDNGGSGALQFVFTDGTVLRVIDAGQDCCEERTLHTDDDLAYHVGASLVSIEVRDGPEEDAEHGDTKESQFLIVTTSKGAFTVVAYNLHNGYYGGFDLSASLVIPETIHADS